MTRSVDRQKVGESVNIDNIIPNLQDAADPSRSRPPQAAEAVHTPGEAGSEQGGLQEAQEGGQRVRREGGGEAEGTQHVLRLPGQRRGR